MREFEIDKEHTTGVKKPRKSARARPSRKGQRNMPVGKAPANTARQQLGAMPGRRGTKAAAMADVRCLLGSLASIAAPRLPQWPCRLFLFPC
ncbi:hypothetical protein HAX54_017981, partial [Datura stramonium]|nr:hypothetical protein [Datura stramonium]